MNSAQIAETKSDREEMVQQQMSAKARAKLADLINRHGRFPTHEETRSDDSLRHFEAKCRLKEILEAAGYTVKFEHHIGVIQSRLKGRQDFGYTTDGYAIHPTLEVRNFYFDVGSNQGDSTYHDSNYNVKHRKLENRQDDIEYGTGKRLVIFQKDELVGEHANSDELVKGKMGLDIL